MRPVWRGVLVAGAIAAGMAALAPVVVRVLLFHGRFTATDAEVVSGLLRVLTIGFVGSMGALLVERAYLAMAHNHVIAGFSFLRVGVRVVLAFLLLPHLQLLAFAVGFGAAEWTYFIALSVFLIRVSARRRASISTTSHERPLVVRDRQPSSERGSSSYRCSLLYPSPLS